MRYMSERKRVGILALLSGVAVLSLSYFHGHTFAVNPPHKKHSTEDRSMFPPHRAHPYVAHPTQGQTNTNRPRAEQKQEQKPKLRDLVIRLLFGPNSAGKSLLSILNHGESPETGALHGFRYEVASKKIFDLGTPAGARSILLRVSAKEGFYLLGGKLYRDRLTKTLTFAGQPKSVNLQGGISLNSLLGFVIARPTELLALSHDNALVVVSLGNGRIRTETTAISGGEVWNLSQQSVAPDGAIAAVDSPALGEWNLLLYSEGVNSTGSDRIGAAGVKLDPRWSDDGSNLTFVQGQPERANGTARRTY